MKNQIPKVGIMSALAFLGFGFAGTQQAHAAGCPKFRCDDPDKCLNSIPVGCTVSPGAWSVGTTAECANCDDVKHPTEKNADGTPKCVAHMAYISYDSVEYYNCPKASAMQVGLNTDDKVSSPEIAAISSKKGGGGGTGPVIPPPPICTVARPFETTNTTCG